MSSTLNAPPSAPARPALVRAGALVGVGSAVANVIAFALTIVIARLLGPADFGAAAALLAVAIIGQVPAMALQAVVARHVAVARPEDRAAQTRTLLRHSLVVAAAVTMTAGAATLPLAPLLHLDSPAPMAWLALTLGPTTLVYAVQGLLQGAERFGALTVLLVVMAATRVAGGITGGFSGLTTVFVGTAVGAVIAFAFAVFLVRHDLRGSAPAAVAPGLYAELLPAIAGVGALLALTNVDVLLARHYLSEEESGLYAAGTIATKIAFWFPQAVAMVVFPRLSDDSQREGMLGRAAAVIVGIGALTSAGCALLGPWALAILLKDPEYTRLGAALGLFAAAGAAGTLVQLVLYSGIAARDRLITGTLALALVVLIGLVTTVAHSSVLAIITAVLGTLSALAVGGLLLSAWRTRARGRA